MELEERVNKSVVKLLPFCPDGIVHRAASPYLAGETLEEALQLAAALQRMRFMFTIDCLGEESDNVDQWRQVVKEYCTILEQLREEDPASNISIKLSHIGLGKEGLGKRVVLDHVRQVVMKAELRGKFVRFDMEDHERKDATIQIYQQLRKEGFMNLGIALQAYLRSSIEDVEDIAALEPKPNVRLCKGIYNPPERIAYKNPDDIRRNFALLLSQMLHAGFTVGIATHDEALIEHAKDLASDLRLPQESYEFQMLLGVRPNLAGQMVQNGYRLRLYLPYGNWATQAKPYCFRRFRENPAMVSHVLHNLLRKEVGGMEAYAEAVNGRYPSR
ncbi:proline dehydrogenase family protein [Candidatus Woesearchaeota archaeon]|nr:proline dehydrogenase family protein [Candidatus Woesearchaeota archaeon]